MRERLGFAMERVCVGKGLRTLRGSAFSVQAFVWSAVLLLLGASGCAGAGVSVGDAPSSPELEYRLYVTNESSDVVSRVVFSPGKGARVEREIPVGIMPADTDGPHGVSVSPDGEHWYVTLAHGTPYGRLWRFRAGADTLEARTTLGRFPASVGTSPDGQFVFVVNFNLHGDMVPSDLSVVHGPTLTEITRVTSCLMPHGSRTNVAGTRHYHVCMHSDQLVELDLTSFEVARRFSFAPGREGPLDPMDRGEDHPGRHEADHQGTQAATCSPTWVATGRSERAGLHVYVACNRGQEVVEVDVDAWRISRRWEVPGSPYNLEATPDGRRLVITLKGGQGIAVVDLDEGEVEARLETSRPVTHGVVIDPDSRYAFVTNESVGAVEGSMDVFDLERLERVATVELRHQPGGIDLWRVDPVGEGPAAVPSSR